MKNRKRILVVSGVCGILAFLGAGLFAVLGAGMYGSPFADGDVYFDLTLLFVLLLGPVAVLPCTILDCFKSGLGGILLCGFAIADVIAICLNNSVTSVFIVQTAGLITFCLALPTFVIGTLLFFSSGRSDGRWKTIWWFELALASVPAVYFSWQVGLDGVSGLIWWMRGGLI